MGMAAGATATSAAGALSEGDHQQVHQHAQPSPPSQVDPATLVDQHDQPPLAAQVDPAALTDQPPTSCMDHRSPAAQVLARSSAADPPAPGIVADFVARLFDQQPVAKRPC